MCIMQNIDFAVKTLVKSIDKRKNIVYNINQRTVRQCREVGSFIPKRRSCLCVGLCDAADKIEVKHFAASILNAIL